MNDNIRIHIFKDASDQEKIVKFLDEHLPFQYSQNSFLWEYGNPKSVFGYLKNTEEEVLGAQGMIYVELNSAGQIIQTAKSETSYLSSKTKGKGLFKKLYLAIVEETFDTSISMIWGLTQLGTLWNKLGFETKNQCICVHSLSISAKKKYYLNEQEADSRLKKFMRYSKATLDSWKTNKKASNARKLDQLNAFLLRQEPLAWGDIQVFFEKLRKKHPKMIHIEMNRAFFEYRIEKNPYLEYTCRYLYNAQNEMEGFYIYSVKNDVVNLVEFSALELNTKKVLLGEAVKEAKEIKAKRLNFFGNRLNAEINETFQLFKAWGSSSYDTEMHIVQRNKDKTKMDFSQLYMNGLWTEGVNL